MAGRQRDVIDVVGVGVGGRLIVGRAREVQLAVLVVDPFNLEVARVRARQAPAERHFGLTGDAGVVVPDQRRVGLVHADRGRAREHGVRVGAGHRRLQRQRQQRQRGDQRGRQKHRGERSIDGEMAHHGPRSSHREQFSDLAALAAGGPARSGRGLT